MISGFIRRCLLAALLALFVDSKMITAAEYQWAVTVPSVISDETKGPPRAFLWVPPNCQRVRGVVLGQHNMLEEPLLEDPAFRATLTELDFAAVWVTPAIGGLAQFGEAEDRAFEAMFQTLAAESGYAELARVPVVPIGHSAMAEFPYLFAAQKPARTLAAISLKGSWPELNKTPPAAWTGQEVAGVPLLFVSGEYEWAEERAGKALPFRRQFPGVPFSMLADAGGGHFDLHATLVQALADYIRKAALYRLPAAVDPAGKSIDLHQVDATQEGWLIDRWRLNKPPRAAAAPVGKYDGDARETYWVFDADHARATEQMQAADAGRKPQLVGYLQGGKVLEQVPGTHQQVTIPFLPEPTGDGLTFKLAGTFLDQVPKGRPERWAAQPAGSQIEHASGGGPVIIRRIAGPVEKLDDDTFALRFDRVGFDNPRRSNEVWLLAEHPGDEHFKRAVQQAVLHFPLRNSEGVPQTIAFSEIPDQPANFSGTIPLAAISSAGADARVRFYVREGPAEIAADGISLRLLPIPTRARFPVKVTVVAWQWGRSIDPKLQTAEPVVRTFQVNQ